MWAVVIGIDDYPGDGHDLRAAVADARTVDATLANHGVGAARRVLLTDAQASARNIRAALDWLVAHAAADATAVFFYAGHVRQVGGDRDADGEAVDEALVAADGEEVLDGELARTLRHLQARSVWLAIAGCYGAGFDDALGPGRLLTAAAAEHDPAYENNALGHSYLVEYMVRRGLLEGRAAGSLQEAFAWARGEIARDYPDRLPVIIDRAGGPVGLRPTSASGHDDRSGSSGSPPPPSPPPPPPQEPPSRAAPPPASPPPAEPDPACTSLPAVTLCPKNQTGPGGHPSGEAPAG